MNPSNTTPPTNQENLPSLGFTIGNESYQHFVVPQFYPSNISQLANPSNSQNYLHFQDRLRGIDAMQPFEEQFKVISYYVNSNRYSRVIVRSSHNNCFIKHINSGSLLCSELVFSLNERPRAHKLTFYLCPLNSHINPVKQYDITLQFWLIGLEFHMERYTIPFFV